MIKAMLLTAKLPKRFWGYTAEYAPELKNEAQHSANENRLQPNSLWGEDFSGIKMLQPFGCKAWIWRPVNTRKDKRLDDAGIPGIFVGSKVHGCERVYRFYNPKTRCVLEGTHVRFAPDEFPGLEDFDSDDIISLAAEFTAQADSLAATKDAVVNLIQRSLDAAAPIPESELQGEDPQHFAASVPESEPLQ
eukprot:2143021-Rhodomonas_salina.1